MRASTRKKKYLVAETAFRLFRERGYDNVSVDDIIAATGTSKGTFYHYFKSKDELLGELPQRQLAVLERWAKERSPLRIGSLESHMLQLFLDLGSVLEPVPRVVLHLAAVSADQPILRRLQSRLRAALLEELMRWLGDREKAAFLMAVYDGTITAWLNGEGASLEELLRRRMAAAWAGIRHMHEAEDWTIGRGAGAKEEHRMKIAVIGGGLAGLTAAAYLSEQPGMEGILFERSPQLGGRAFTYEKAGFTLNYGAHAIYGIDRHTLSTIEQELGLSFGSRQVDKRRVMYAKNGEITTAPLDFVNLMKTDLLDAKGKMRFAAEAAAVIANIHTLKNYPTLGDYLAESGADDTVKELWEHLVCSNFFIAPEDARKVPGHVISDYYHNLFLSQRPVNYILGSWAVITNQLKLKIESSGRWNIALQEGAESIRYENGRYVIATKKREEAFDRVVFAMPVQQVAKLLKGTPWEPFLAPYENNRSTEVMVYDIGLSRIVARPFSYISDLDSKMFITDVSATDDTLVPEGGQLLQGVAYLADDAFENEEQRKAYLDERLAGMEALFDRHYPGWREAVVVKRVSKKAMVQSVKHTADNRLLPVRLESVPFYFCGDGCEGKGELAERAFSSARKAAELLAAELKPLAAAAR
ncbi:Putative Amine oxidase [Thermobacillus xylanilyticus]|uniref:Amine oxidase n=1 Tax=Thermobacillus xylanilyticus TaxID=76633 RepID=A0ABN7S7P2_THEXY|nr:FAD-dependent oxidoreductase [Thermobacillus xylanilyticus]CAG5093294.1 Putative Amine oxidase [Thermobacillus xylanilyticus]